LKLHSNNDDIPLETTAHQSRTSHVAPQSNNGLLEDGGSHNNLDGCDDDGVTLDLSIAEVSGLTNPTFLRSKEDASGEYSSTATSYHNSRVCVPEHHDGRGPSEASSSQPSEAATPLLTMALRSKFVNSSDDFYYTPFGRSSGMLVELNGEESDDSRDNSAWDPDVFGKRVSSLISHTQDNLTGQGWMAFQEQELSDKWENFGSSNFMHQARWKEESSSAQNLIAQRDEARSQTTINSLDPQGMVPNFEPINEPIQWASSAGQGHTVGQSKHKALISKLRSLKEARVRRSSRLMYR